jgi:hypothetical protein
MYHGVLDIYRPVPGCDNAADPHGLRRSSHQDPNFIDQPDGAVLKATMEELCHLHLEGTARSSAINA